MGLLIRLISESIHWLISLVDILCYMLSSIWRIYSIQLMVLIVEDEDWRSEIDFQWTRGGSRMEWLSFTFSVAMHSDSTKISIGKASWFLGIAYGWLLVSQASEWPRYHDMIILESPLYTSIIRSSTWTLPAWYLENICLILSWYSKINALT